jgi:antitoxin CptB
MTLPPGQISESGALDALRRKLGFRAWHRGTREADLLIGSFADRNLGGFDGAALAQFERLLAENDPDIHDWMTGRLPVPPEHDNQVTALLRQFRLSPTRS